MVDIVWLKLRYLELLWVGEFWLNERNHTIMLSRVRVTSRGLHIVTETKPATSPATKFWYLSFAFIWNLKSVPFIIILVLTNSKLFIPKFNYILKSLIIFLILTIIISLLLFYRIWRFFHAFFKNFLSRGIRKTKKKS